MRSIPNAIKLAKQEIIRPHQGIALAEARRQNSSETDLLGWCLLSVRTWLGIPAKYRSAIKAWEATPDRHRHTDGSTPPKGAPVFWAIGPHGHIALSDGNGYCISTDIKRRGKADRVLISRVTNQWGAKYLGWASWLNGEEIKFPVTTKVTEKKITVSPPLYPGRHVFQIGKSHPSITLMEKELIRRGFTKHKSGPRFVAGPMFTKNTRLNVADFQRSEPRLAGDPDGYPGPLTWKELFSR